MEHMVESGVLDWGSFIIGVVFASGVFVLLTLLQSKRSLKASKSEIEELKKKLNTKKEKEKTKKPE